MTKDPLPGDQVGNLNMQKMIISIHRDHLKSIVKGDFSGMKIILDAANGSAYRAAKDVFLSLGAGKLL